MESRISVRVDFDNNNTPILQIIQKTSEDTRDEILNNFLESLQYKSQWLVIQYAGSTPDFTKWRIKAVTPADVPKELLVMKELAREITGSSIDSQVIEDMNAMCTESLPPDVYLKWEEVTKLLIKTRKELEGYTPSWLNNKYPPAH